MLADSMQPLVIMKAPCGGELGSPNHGELLVAFVASTRYVNKAGRQLPGSTGCEALVMPKDVCEKGTPC